MIDWIDWTTSRRERLECNDEYLTSPSGRRPVAVVLVLFFFASPLFAADSTPVWDPPKIVTEKSVFFGEAERPDALERGEPLPGDKSYPWFWLERGNNYLLAGYKEKAAAAFANAYAAGGNARIASGFKRVETLETLGKIDEAIFILEEMKREHLVSNNDFAQAQRLRSRLEDQKKKMTVKPVPAFDGAAWLKQVQTERMRYVMDAMKELRAHGVPLALSAHQYAFRMDEYFLAHPNDAAGDGTDVLSRIVYEDDPAARVPIDQWRIDPASTAVQQTVKTDNPAFTGAEWITMTHGDKMKYIQEAMAVLRRQNVPMKSTPYAYEYAVDEMFTDDPELPAADCVVTLASLLYKTEPEAREVLEALRLR